MQLHLTQKTRRNTFFLGGNSTLYSSLNSDYLQDRSLNPASSSSSERLFSLAGLFDSEKLGNLKTETLGTLTPPKVNQKLIEANIVNLDDVDEEEERGQEVDEGLKKVKKRRKVRKTLMKIEIHWTRVI